jgi:hypothetical protein
MKMTIPEKAMSSPDPGPTGDGNQKKGDRTSFFNGADEKEFRRETPDDKGSKI